MGLFCPKNNVGANLIKIGTYIHVVLYTFYHVYKFQEDLYRTILKCDFMRSDEIS